MRKTAREAAFKILFSTQFNDEYEYTMRSVIKFDKLDENDIAFCEKIVKTVIEHKVELAKIIDEHSRQFPETRLFPADRVVLLISIAEILYFDDIPSTVSVNEAANIASKYSSGKSASFISGILSEII